MKENIKSMERDIFCFFLLLLLGCAAPLQFGKQLSARRALFTESPKQISQFLRFLEKTEVANVRWRILDLHSKDYSTHFEISGIFQHRLDEYPSYKSHIYNEELKFEGHIIVTDSGTVVEVMQAKYSCDREVPAGYYRINNEIYFFGGKSVVKESIFVPLKFFEKFFTSLNNTIEIHGNGNSKYISGWTNLMVAAQKGQTEEAKRLIEMGVNTQAKNKNGWSALMYAVANGNTDIARLLIDKGANLNEKDKKGWTVLMIAAIYGQTEAAQLLIKKGANIGIKANSGLTALMYAEQYGSKDITKLLIEK